MEFITDVRVWIPAATTSALFAFILFLSREAISKFLIGKVQLKFDGQLARLKADLDAKESEIAALRTGALTGFWSRRAAFEKRRMEAAEKLWEAASALGSQRMAVEFMQRINAEESAKISESNPNAREFFGTLTKLVDLEKIKHLRPEHQRPFVPPLVWALFAAYQAIIFNAITELKALESGVHGKIIKKNTTHIKDLIAVALPHQVRFLDQNSDWSQYFLLDELKEKLLDEIKKMFSSAVELDSELKQANEILEAANRLRTANKDFVEV